MRLAARIAAPIAVLITLAAAVAPVLAASAAVSIVGQAYEPGTITISPGDTVIWTVTESIDQPHSVTSGTPEAPTEIFDSGIGEGGESVLEANGQTFQHTFAEPGEFPYYCTIHPTTMTGMVVVADGGASAPPSGEPAPSGEPSASGEPHPAEDHPAVTTERKVAAGTILGVALVLMFLMAWVWRRMNPA